MSLDAAIADAAVSEVRASSPTALVSAAWRLTAVAAVDAPMVNSFGPGVGEFVAVSVTFAPEPSGSANENLTASPGLGLVAPRSTDIAAGDPAGPVTVEPVRGELIPASLNPNGEPVIFKDTETTVP